jgi:hypothetical protein
VGDSSEGNLAAVVACTLARDGSAARISGAALPDSRRNGRSPSYSEFASGYGFSREGSLWYFDQ